MLRAVEGHIDAYRAIAQLVFDLERFLSAPLNPRTTQLTIALRDLFGAEVRRSTESALPVISQGTE